MSYLYIDICIHTHMSYNQTSLYDLFYLFIDRYTYKYIRTSIYPSHHWDHWDLTTDMKPSSRPTKVLDLSRGSTPGSMSVY